MSSPFSDAIVKQSLAIRAKQIIARLRDVIMDAGALAEVLGTLSSVSSLDVEAAAVPLDQAERLTFPCTVCAHFEHFATGEGRTMGILIRYFEDHLQLREAVFDEWGEYFSHGAYVQPWTGVPSGFEGFIPSDVTSMLADPGSVHAVRYTSTLHYNLS